MVIPHEASKWMVAAGMWSGRKLGKGDPLPPSKLATGVRGKLGVSGAGNMRIRLHRVGEVGPIALGAIAAGGGMGSAAPVAAAQQQAEAANEAVKAAAAQQQATQSTQIINTIARGNEDLVDIMISVDRQIRDLRSEMPDALKAAIQQVI